MRILCAAQARALTSTSQFSFTLTDQTSPSQATGAVGEGRRGPKVYKVKLSLVNTINTEYVPFYQ